MLVKMLDAATANGAGPAVASRLRDWRPSVSVWCWGTFDGAAVALEVSPDGETWFPVLDADGDPVSFDAADFVVVDMPTLAYRGVVSSAGGSTSLHMAIF